MRSLCRLVFFLGLTFISMKCFAQTAAITGQIQDASGAVIRGAEIRIVEQSQGTTRTLHTNNAGAYSAPFLNPGSYRVYVQAPSFSTAASGPLVLTVGQTLVFNVTLQVGGAQQEVSVDGGSSLINTSDASVSTVVDQKFVKNMPLNGRSFQDLISMTPGVITASPQSSPSVQSQGDFSVNGQRTEANYYTLDGVSANTGAGFPNGTGQSGTTGSVPGSTALGTTQSLISVDALQEFRVSSSSYSAEYGRSPGGQFSFTSRAGTNAVHGTAFDYLRNDVFDANDWFNNFNGVRKTALRQNDFGGTLGGPIIIPKLYSGKDRSFFFFSYEGLRLLQPTAATLQYVPSAAVRSAAPAPLQPVFNAFPLPTGNELLTSTGVLSGLSPFVAGYSLPGSVDSTSIRLDQRLTSRLNSFFRYSDTPTSTSSRTLSTLLHQSQNSVSYTLGVDGMLNHGITNSFRLGFTDSTAKQTGALDSFGGANPGNFHDLFGVPGAYATYQYYPYLNVTGVGSAALNVYNASNGLRQWNMTDTVALSTGHHQVRIGVDYRHLTSPLNPTAIATYAYFYSRAAMVGNAATTAYIYKLAPATPTFNELSVFAQDEWRVAPTVSISAGIRWEFNPPMGATDGRIPYTAYGNPKQPSTLTLAPPGTPLWSTYWYNFAPRLGIAWTAHQQQGHETVIRAGAGVFYDTGNQTAATGYTGVGYRALVSKSNVALPFDSSLFNFSINATAPYTSAVVYVFPHHLQAPYTLQWNIGLDQAMGRAQTMTLTYVGASGRRLLQRQLSNVSSLNPNFGSILYYPNGVTSNYNALQLKFQRSVTKGLQALASYTWSHSLDYGSTNASYPLTYGNSDFDVRNNFQGGLSWDIPSSVKHSTLAFLSQGWGIDGRLNIRSAFPITLTGNLLVDSTGTQYYSGVNYNPAHPIYLYGSQYPGGRAMNGGPKVSPATAAFTLPTGTAAGNASRNFVRGFAANQVNVAVRRNFVIAEPLSLQFRAEAFNILNHANFGYIDPTLSDAQFGQATKMLNASLGSQSSLYQQGGPRSMQFTLKLIF
ncbi:carboxypeptidase regulatory-like domain-containing protein [Granulicella cerasi]|uniref:Carboxypeptidase regulatory-like domain-containing protein n=1 Tax=Granulicella cerasi TaxID=741063 RepID=A0ABW1Z8M0_9BACT|nr:carboxypeptidase-like regulatory domain-containing protein [Granulicella cerasi]